MMIINMKSKIKLNAILVTQNKYKMKNNIMILQIKIQKKTKINNYLFKKMKIFKVILKYKISSKLNKKQVKI